MSLSKLKAIADEPGSVVYAEGGVTMPVLLQHSITRSLSGTRMGRRHSRDGGRVCRHECGTRLGEMKMPSRRCASYLRPARSGLPASAIPFSYRRARLPPGIVAGVWLQLKPGVEGEDSDDR